MFIEKFIPIVSKDIYLSEMVIPINEAYFGKTPEVMEIEKRMSILRRKYMNNPIAANSSKELADLCHAVEKAFGFSIFSLTIDGSMAQNACTLPVSDAFGTGDPTKHIIAGRNGFKYDGSAEYCTIVFINNGIMFNTYFTDEEITGLLLHEIGHNFFPAGDNIGKGFSYIQRVMNVMALPVEFLFAIVDPQMHGTIAVSVIPGVKRKFLEWVNKKRKIDPAGCIAFDGYMILLKTFIGSFMTGFDMINTIQAMFNPVGSILSTLMTNLKGIAANGPMPIIKALTGTAFRNEAASDNFATMYGYGPALQSSLSKIKDADGGMIGRSMIRSIPLIGSYADFMFMPGRVLFGFMDGHPEDGFRCIDQIRYLEKEITKSNVSKPMKAEMQKQIQELKKTLDKLTSLMDLGHIFLNMYTKLLVTLVGGDMRGFFARDIDKMYDRMSGIPDKHSK